MFALKVQYLRYKLLSMISLPCYLVCCVSDTAALASLGYGIYCLFTGSYYSAIGYGIAVPMLSSLTNEFILAAASIYVQLLGEEGFQEKYGLKTLEMGMVAAEIQREVAKVKERI